MCDSIDWKISSFLKAEEICSEITSLMDFSVEMRLVSDAVTGAGSTIDIYTFNGVQWKSFRTGNLFLQNGHIRTYFSPGETKKFCSGIIIGNSCLEGVAFIEYRIYYMTPLGKRMQKKDKAGLRRRRCAFGLFHLGNGSHAQFQTGGLFIQGHGQQDHCAPLAAVLAVSLRGSREGLAHPMKNKVPDRLVADGLRQKGVAPGRLFRRFQAHSGQNRNTEQKAGREQRQTAHGPGQQSFHSFSSPNCASSGLTLLTTAARRPSARRTSISRPGAVCPTERKISPRAVRTKA